MSKICRSLMACVFWVSCPVLALACLWDYDTLKMERQRFPTTLELITGKFLRHSPEFYQWRIQDRLKKLAVDPQNLALYDDLAVAYDKTGRQDLAIETILKKERLKPGLYETEANIGTFLIHSGKLEEGLAHIDKAIEINPDAHFGREKYQKYLVEYVLSRRDQRPTAVLADYEWVGEAPEQYLQVKADFADFLASKTPGREQHQGLSPAERAVAVKGVLSIMKFGNFDSPFVLEVLGDLLLPAYDPSSDAKQLAARAYLKARRETKDEDAKKVYYERAKVALRMQTSNSGELSIATLEEQLQSELNEAAAWYQTLHDKERQWIREGKNVEQEFDRLYDVEPRVKVAAAYERSARVSPNTIIAFLVAIFIGVSISLAVFVVAIFRWWRGCKRRELMTHAAPTPPAKCGVP